MKQFKSLRLLFLFNLLFISSEIFSQALTVSTTQLNFGNAYENAPDSLPLTIFNNQPRTINVTGARFYNTYGAPAFSINTTNFSIPSMSSQVVWIKFSPRHNIYHNSELVIKNDGLRGYVNVDLKGQGKYSNTYYDPTENLEEENLKTAIHTITGIGYDTLGYNFARDSMFMWLDNQRTNGQGAVQNTLEGVYTGALATGYTSRTDCQTTFSFNTEHTFPQAFFSSNEPMKSDLHHLFPTDDASNNYRANNPFGVVASPTWTSGGSSGTTSLFEPRDQQKGATARAMMYFVLRYQNYSNFFTPQENILRTWHRNFPPSQVERKRNDDINMIQHNRNPFVDYPQFIERIDSISGFAVAPVLQSVDLTEDTMIYGFVQQGIPVDFHYVLVNNGNTVIQLTNFHLSNPGIVNFPNGRSDTTLGPGDALGVDVRLIASSANAILEFLTFNTNVPGRTAVSIPIYANDSLVSGIRDAGSEDIFIFPNPVKDRISISMTNGGNLFIQVFAVAGNEVMQLMTKEKNSVSTFDISSLDAGIYLLKVTAGKEIIFRKIIKE